MKARKNIADGLDPDQNAAMLRNAAQPLRIFIEPGGYRWGNLGDTMMLEVALARLRSFWPDASIKVHCLNPERLRLLDARAEALDPSRIRAFPALAGRLPRSLRAMLPRAKAYLDAVRSADLVLLSGAGSLNDSFKEHALEVLETIELAMKAGAVTALMGQGIGPMKDATLRHRAATILPRVDLIALRESLAGLSLLQSMGVVPAEIKVTGDDAIALGYNARPPTLGSSLGVNVRSAFYSEVGGDLLSAIGNVVREAGERRNTAIVPIPISRYSGEDDLETVRRMMRDASFGEQADVGTTPELLPLVSQCRVVVAGSYHAAVLALSMGIPAVAIARSDYYIDKFRGLAGQFGPACRVELTSHPDFLARLRSAIDGAWESAGETREHLLRAAAQQIERSESAYRHVFDLVEERRQLRKRT
ncbi:MAG: polysaccharide pyruvyl transferase family protein [Thermoanaerobaculia bacterium]